MGMSTASLWVTNEWACPPPSSPVWYYFGVVGSFIFIIIQLILLVDFAHSWNLAWLQNAEDGNRKCWFGGERRGRDGLGREGWGF